MFKRFSKITTSYKSLFSIIFPFILISCAGGGSKTDSPAAQSLPEVKFSKVNIESLGERRVLDSGEYKAMDSKGAYVNLNFENGDLQENASFTADTLNLGVTGTDNDFDYQTQETSLKQIMLNEDDNNSLIYHFEEKIAGDDKIVSSYRVFIPSDYEYVFYASQNLLGQLEQNLDTYGRYFHGGNVAPITALTGEVTYNSTISMSHYIPLTQAESQNYQNARFAVYSGSGEVKANFNTGSVLGNFGSLTSDTLARNSLAPTDVKFTASLNNGSFNGSMSFSYFGENIIFSENDLSGMFYGPNGEEIAATSYSKVSEDALNFVNEEFVSIILGKK